MYASTHDLLKAKTAELHRNTESQLNVRGLMAGTAGPKVYHQLIATHHTISRAFLAAAETTAERELTPYVGLIRSFSDGLHLDMKTAGYSSATVAAPSFSGSREVTAGMLYVLLGAARGARMILPRLKGLPAISAANSFFYLEKAAAVSDEQWKGFILLLNGQINGETKQERALEGARHAFRSFIRVHTLLESTPEFCARTVKD